MERQPRHEDNEILRYMNQHGLSEYEAKLEVLKDMEIVAAEYPMDLMYKERLRDFKREVQGGERMVEPEKKAFIAERKEAYKNQTVTVPKKRKEPERRKCIRCGEDKIFSGFYKTQNPLYAGFGVMPVCKACVEELYDVAYRRFQDNYRSVMYLCRELNVYFSETVFNRTSNIVAATGEPIFGIYLQQISRDKATYSKVYEDSDTYIDVLLRGQQMNQQVMTEEDISREYVEVWGAGYTQEDYEFLDGAYSKWIKDVSAKNYNEVVMLQSICKQQLYIHKLQIEGKSTVKDTLELHNMMKNAALTPKDIKASDNSEALQAIGMRIKEIEEYEPAEFFRDKSIYTDFDNIGKYYEEHVLRPVLNTLTGSREFNMKGIDPNILNTISTFANTEMVEIDDQDVEGDE